MKIIILALSLLAVGFTVTACGSNNSSPTSSKSGGY